MPPGDAPKATPRQGLKQLLSAEEQAGLLSVDEGAGGQATVRLNAATMFPSGASVLADEQLTLIGRVAVRMHVRRPIGRCARTRS